MNRQAWTAALIVGGLWLWGRRGRPDRGELEARIADAIEAATAVAGGAAEDVTRGARDLLGELHDTARTALGAPLSAVGTGEVRGG